MNNAASPRCGNGHEVLVGDLFCVECGASVEVQRIDGTDVGSDPKRSVSDRNPLIILGSSLVAIVLVVTVISFAASNSRRSPDAVGVTKDTVNTSNLTPPTMSGALSTTTSVVESTASCPQSALFQIAHQSPQASKYQMADTPILPNEPITATCVSGWAVLNGFSWAGEIGQAIFEQSSGTWHFLMFGDTSGAGPGYDPCSQYPPAAVQALGRNLCSAPVATTTTRNLVGIPAPFTGETASQYATQISALGLVPEISTDCTGIDPYNIMPGGIGQIGPPGVTAQVPPGSTVSIADCSG